jgi:uncharacterized protein YndB with AHSA1/START domain
MMKGLTPHDLNMTNAQITPDQDTILAEIFIAAPPARVFEAITDPKQRAQWWGIKSPSPSSDVVPFRVIDSKSDLRVGGKWTNEGIRGDGQRFHLEGEYLEIDPPRLLVHTRVADFVGPFTTIVRWELAPQEVRELHTGGSHRVGTGTLVRLRHSGFAGHPEQAQSHYGGWCISLGWLKTFVETGETFETRK